MSGREKVWFNDEVRWIELPDEALDDDDSLDPVDYWAELMLALGCLTDKQRFVIECRYGLRSAPLELVDIAQLMGITKQAVAGIEARAIEKMRGLTGGLSDDRC